MFGWFASFSNWNLPNPIESGEAIFVCLIAQQMASCPLSAQNVR